MGPSSLKITPVQRLSGWRDVNPVSPLGKKIPHLLAGGCKSEHRPGQVWLQREPVISDSRREGRREEGRQGRRGRMKRTGGGGGLGRAGGVALPLEERRKD